VVATTGVIFAAAYLLWAIERILFGRVENPENESIPDLTARELLVLAPLLACIIWIGVYPAPILRRTEASAQALVNLVRTPREIPVVPGTPGVR
jgi:NADH-quinone oxidoreductase subunit M